MKYNRSQSKASLFLIELLIIIAFFSVASANCIRLFARAHMLSIESRDVTRAVLAAQSAAESFKSACGEPERIARLIGGRLEPGGVVVAYYDKNWQASGESSEQGFLVRMRIGEEEKLYTADIEVKRAQGNRDRLYTLHARQFGR